MKKQSGFTLLELLIAVSIVAILASIAYPMYTSQVERSNRLAVQGEMMDLAASLETYRAQNFSYGGADLAVLSPKILSNKYYDAVFIDPGTGNPVSVMPAGAQGWIIRVSPQAGGQMVGTGALQLDNRGRTCWDKAADTGCDLDDTALSWGQH